MFHNQRKVAQLKNLLCRTEKHGPDDVVPVVDLSVGLTLGVAELEEIAPGVASSSFTATLKDLPDVGPFDVEIDCDGAETLLERAVYLRKTEASVSFKAPPKKVQKPKPEPDPNEPVQDALPGVPEPEPVPEPVEEPAAPTHECTLSGRIALHVDDGFPYYALHGAVGDEVDIRFLSHDDMRRDVQGYLVDYPIPMMLAVDPADQYVIEDRQSEIVRRVVAERRVGEGTEEAFHRLLQAMAKRDREQAQQDGQRQEREQLAGYVVGSAPWVALRLKLDLEGIGFFGDEGSASRAREVADTLVANGQTDADVLAMEMLADIGGAFEGGDPPVLGSLRFIAEKVLEAHNIALHADDYELLPGTWQPKDRCHVVAAEVYGPTRLPTAKATYSAKDVAVRVTKKLTGRKGSFQPNGDLVAYCEEMIAGWTPATQETGAAPDDTTGEQPAA